MSRRPHVLGLAVLTSLGAAACLPLPGGHTLQRREVVNKGGENRLVSRDGAFCRVTADTYERVQIGDQHTCAWREHDREGGERVDPEGFPLPRRQPPGQP